MNMVNNLFSIFDPSTYYRDGRWIIIAIPIIIVKSIGMKTSSKKIINLNAIANKIKTEISDINKSRRKKITSEIISTLFIVVMIINIIAIMPFNFTVMAHISTSLPLALTLWISVMVNATSNSMKKTLVHLTPIGTPTPLINFIVIIEIVSNIIRPITLSVRLVANIVAGHLLISLLSNFSITRPIITIWAGGPIIVLIALEIAVAVIQAYVITTLICLYYKETF